MRVGVYIDVFTFITAGEGSVVEERQDGDG